MAPTTAGRRLIPGLATDHVSGISIRSERSDTPLKGELSLMGRKDGDWLLDRPKEPAVPARAGKVRSLLEALREASFIRELSSASKGALDKHGLAEGQRVVLTIDANGTHQVKFGADVSEHGVAVQVDDNWPPVEVDRQLLDDVAVDAASWRETRLAPFDSSSAQSVRVVFPKQPASGFFASRESGQWAIREPALIRADQGLIARLLASLAGLESRGPFSAGTASAPSPGVLVRYEVAVSGRSEPWVIEIGDQRTDDVVPGRASGDQKPANLNWDAVSLAGLELVTQPIGEFRSRKLLDMDTTDIQDVVVTPSVAGALHLVRGGTRLYFVAPPEWNWMVLGKPKSLPLDASAQADFLQGLSQLEATDFERGPAFEPDRTVVIRHGAAGAPASEVRLRFGADDGGKRAFGRLGSDRDGHVRSAAIAFLAKPYWELLTRQLYEAMWFSFTRIEVEEVARRKVTITALATGGNEPDFVLTDPHGDLKRRLPREVVNPVTDKLCLLTVERFVGHGSPEKFGLDHPQFIVKWLDSGKSQGTVPDPAVGHWVTWRIAPRGPDGLNAGEVDSAPGLIFKTEGRDLDPFLNLLDWANR